jgi:hypothetical protein
MQMKPLHKLLFIGISSLLIISPMSNANSEVDPYPNIEIPMLQGSYKVKMFVNQPKGTKSLNYFIKTAYPANEVLQFYELKLKEAGFLPSLAKQKRQWESFIDDTNKGNTVRQLLASWINPNLKAEAFLALRYTEVGKKWTNELHIICQIQPIFDRKRLENFITRLRDTKQYEKFMKLLDSYRMPDGEVNIDRAITENPQNYDLREYKKIVDGMTKNKTLPETKKKE